MWMVNICILLQYLSSFDNQEETNNQMFIDFYVKRLNRISLDPTLENDTSVYCV